MKKYLLIIAASILFLPSFSYASTCNFNQVTANDGMRWDFNGTTEQWGATRFTPNSTCYIKTAAANMRLEGSPSGTVTINLYTDSGGVPTSLIETGSSISPSLTTTYGWATSTFAGTTQLVNGTNYWLVVKSTATADGVNYYRWQAQDSNLGGGMKHGNTTAGWADWDVVGASGMYSVSGDTALPTSPFNFWQFFEF